MFHGSIPDKMRAFVAETVHGWGAREVWVGCSGNFTIERTLQSIAHHGNDVTIYSAAIGWWAAGQDIPITLKEEYHEELGWLLPGMETREGIVATVMLGTQLFPSVGKDNVFHRRQYEAYKHQWPTLLEKTVHRVENSGLKLDSYYNGDVNVWLEEEVPEDAAVLCFPPFFKGDYESQNKSLEQYLDWPAPEYELMDEEGKQLLIDRITSRPNWVIGLHDRWDEIEGNLRGIMQTTNRGVPINIYTSDSPVRVVTPNQRLKQLAVPRLTEDIELDGTEKVSISVLEDHHFSALRSQYMNHNIKPGQPALSLALLIDERLIGCIAFLPPKYDKSTAYMLSDFPITESRYLRISALIVKLAQSREVQMLLERAFSRTIRWIETTAFTNNPVSMKYRSGGMKLRSRKPADDGLHKNQLQYNAPIGEQTLTELFGDWFKKHSGKTKEIR